MPMGLYFIDNIEYHTESGYITNSIVNATISIKANSKSIIPLKNLESILYSVIVRKRKAAIISLNIFDDSRDSYKIKQFYKNYYNFYNSPKLPGNISQHELEEVLYQMKNIYKVN